MATINLSANVRKGTGKGAARKIRKQGLVPASIYRGGKEPSLITINPNTVDTITAALANETLEEASESTDVATTST